MRLRPLPGHHPTPFQAWCAGHAIGFSIACGIVTALFLLLAWTAERVFSRSDIPPANDTFAVTEIDLRARDVPSWAFRIDGSRFFPEWNGALDDGTRVGVTTRQFVRGETVEIETGHFDWREQRFDGPAFLRFTGGFDCRVIAHLHPDRIDVSECLVPVAGRR